MRIASCLPGTLEEVTVSAYREGTGSADGEPVLWQVMGSADEGPGVAAGGAVVVVIGDPPQGLFEPERLARPLPEDKRIEVEVRLSSQSFGYDFAPRDLEAGTLLLQGGDHVDIDEFEDIVDGLCS